MAIDFPSSPSVGDTFTSGGRTFRWNGTTWDTYIDSAGALTHADNHASGGADPVTLAQSQVTGLTTALDAKVDSTDARLTDARTPTSHAASHASGGSDAITIAQSQVTNLTTDLAAKASTSDLALKAPLASPTFTGTVVLPSTTSVGSVSSTEIGYLDGVTSSLQSQIDAKASIVNPLLKGGTSDKVSITSDGRIIEYLSNAFGGGYKIHLGIIPWGNLTGTYVHIKMSYTRYSALMVGYSLYGFGYSSACIVSHMTVYTYGGQSTPYQPTYRNLGNAGGFVNCYYSSGTENMVLVIDKQGSAYTGGHLIHWTGGAGFYSDASESIVAMAGSNATSGVY